MKNNIKKVLLIQNPKSGQSESNEFMKFKALLLDNEITVSLRNLKEGVGISELIKDANEFDCIVTAGGDGTVCAVAHELKEDIPLFVYPAGTANLVAQNLGMYIASDKLIDVLLNGDTIPIDIPNIKNSSKNAGFIVATGAGIDANMIKESESMKSSLGTLAYVVGALKNVAPQEAEFTLNIDGQEIITKGICVLVANLGMINFKIPLADGIDPTDGLLNIIVFKGSSILSLAPNILDSIKYKFGIGQPEFAQNLEIYKGKKVSVNANPEMPLQYDGEVLEGNTPFEAEITDKKVKFFYSDPEIST
ncbi:MAG: diacylglycerol kinase family protein [Candidatus Sericytochromatia bacterium]